MLKHPKAPHIPGSRATKTDPKLDLFDANNMLSNRITMQEKLDGYNVQLYFTKFGKLSMKHGNKSVPGSAKFSKLRKWAEERESLLMNYLGENLVIFGEWMYYRNSVFYNKLSSFFYIVDVYDKENEMFWCTDRVCQICSVLDLEIVPTVISGVFDQEDVARMATRQSAFGSDSVEGLYVRREDEHRVIERAQFISPSEELVRSKKKNKLNVLGE